MGVEEAGGTAPCGAAHKVGKGDGHTGKLFSRVLRLEESAAV
jgi:hypothetical protein